MVCLFSPSLPNSYYGLLTLIALANLALFIWPVSAKYTYREFAPPSHADAAVLGMGRSVAGPALAPSKSSAGMLHTPLSRTLIRKNTIQPYASSAVKNDRLARALSRNASMASGTLRSGARSGPLAVSGRSTDSSGRWAAVNAAADAAVAAAAARASPPRPPLPHTPPSLLDPHLDRISEFPSRLSMAGATEEEDDDDAVAARPPRVDEGK